jgi:hypothetical protein
MEHTTNTSNAIVWAAFNVVFFLDRKRFGE